MFLLIIILFCLLIILLDLYYRYSRGPRLINKLKGPKLMFFFGNVWEIQGDPVYIFYKQLEWWKKYGDLFRLVGFHYRAIFVHKPEDLETVLSSSRFNEKTYPYMFLHSWLREGLLTSNGEKWQQRRKMLTPAFHFNILKKFFNVIRDHTEDLMQYVGEEVDKDKTSLAPLISKQTLKVICETSMGINMREESKKPITNKYFNALPELTESVIYRANKLWLFTDPVYNLTTVAKKEKKALKDLHDFTTNVIKERRKLRENTNVEDFFEADEVYGRKTKLAMLDLLLDEENKGKIDEPGIREEVDTFMFEGHDTTATAICFMIMRIANEPKVQDLIYEELQSIFGDTFRTTTLEDLTQMKYLECCIKESLRIYPSVPFMARYITEECNIGGYTIPKNTFCNINVFAIHRNPKIFPDPEKFVPERFQPENIVKIHPYAYIPFSAGPRNCIGQKFAMMELKTVMSSLLWRYRLEPITKPEDLVFKSDLVLRTTHPLYVRFCRRNNN
ncbi:cytochrome P450 4C1-like [Anticarsia gemmatalis]|uniref:cytochrome P450 4C1-like n=1 Tax=Anticarsia gemmatalis TaxID=129554 RepID=UPI003F76F9F7